MTLSRGQIVEITRIDDGDDPGWVGFQAKVADAYLEGPPVIAVVEDRGYTKLIPLSERPDAHQPEIDPMAWFFWPTDDLRVVYESLELQVRVDVFRTAVPWGSPGALCAVRVTHLPTGIVTTCEEFASERANRDAAMAELRDRLHHENAAEEDVYGY